MASQLLAACLVEASMFPVGPRTVEIACKLQSQVKDKGTLTTSQVPCDLTYNGTRTMLVFSSFGACASTVL